MEKKSDVYTCYSEMITPDGFKEVHYISGGDSDMVFFDYKFEYQSVTEEEFTALKLKYFNEADMITPQGKYNSTEMIEIINNM